jgi:16S rRNA G1207 methylase RsmC
LIFGYTATSDNNPLENVFGELLELSDFDLTLFNTPHVFSSGKLDIGSRFFLNNFPNLAGCEKLIDLGCGNGVLGLMALKQNPQVDVTFVDESYHAICAAKASVNFLLGNKAPKLPGENDDERVHFQVNHCLDGYPANSVDTILCNPPFHQQQAVGTRIARQMFRESAQVLRPGGSLYVIGNRHLNYHIELKKQFRQVSVKASDRKFVIYAAYK